MIDDPCDGHPAMMGNILIKIQRIIICHVVVLHILIMKMSMVKVVEVFMGVGAMVVFMGALGSSMGSSGGPMGVTMGSSGGPMGRVTPINMADGYTILGGYNHFI